MDPESFERIKSEILNKKDKSRAQVFDKEILPLVKKINSSKDYFTTSSCAGRIIILELSEDAKKYKTKWHYVSHKAARFSDIRPILEKSARNMWFKMESPILHVNCRTLEHAYSLLRYVISIGLKHSGIISIGTKNIVEIVDTNFISTLIMKDNKLLVNEDYIKELIKISNSKLKTSRERFNKVGSFFNAKRN